MHFLLCVKNEGHSASSEVRKVYQAIHDPSAEKHRLVRVIDESGDDHLYPQRFFIPVELPSAAKKAFLMASYILRDSLIDRRLREWLNICAFSNGSASAIRAYWPSGRAHTNVKSSEKEVG